MNAVSLRDEQAGWLKTLKAPDDAAHFSGCLTAWCAGVRTQRDALAVYINNVRSNLIQALSLTYPVTKAQAGSALFHRAVLLGLRYSPPVSGDLGDYGAALPEMLARLCAVVSRNDAAQLIALAELEWQLDQMRREPEDTAWSLADASGVDSAQWPMLRVRLAQPFRLVRVDAAVLPVLKTTQAQLGIVLIEQLPGASEPRSNGTEPHVHLLMRPETALLLAPAAWHWLTLLESSYEMEQTTVETLTLWPNFNFQALLTHLLQCGSLARIPSLETAQRP